jgi:hypothetical protein
MSASTAVVEEGIGGGRSLLLDDTAEQVFMIDTLVSI